MELSFEVREPQQVIVVRLRGRLVAPEETADVRQWLKARLPVNNKLLLDLSGVIEIDSGGMGTLAELALSARKKGGDLKLLNASEKIKKPFQMTRLEATFEWFTSESEALASFR